MPVKSQKLGPGLLTVGETASAQEFAAQLRACKIEHNIDEEDNIPVLSGEEIAGDETITYMLTGTILDDYSMTGLAVWAKTNQGTELPFIFVPNSEEGTMQVKGTVKIRPIDFGGDVKSRNENDFEFKGIGDWTPTAYTGA